MFKKSISNSRHIDQLSNGNTKIHNSNVIETEWHKRRNYQTAFFRSITITDEGMKFYHITWYFGNTIKTARIWNRALENRYTVTIENGVNYKDNCYYCNVFEKSYKTLKQAINAVYTHCKDN